MRVAFCPSPPLLVPEVASGAAGELDGLRAACDAAVAAVVAGAASVTVLGVGSRVAVHGGDVAGTFRPFGVDRVVGGTGAMVLPTSLAVGAWLLDRAQEQPPRRYVELAPTSTPDDADVVQAVGSPGGPGHGPGDAWLVLADGSAGLDPKAPGALIPGASAFDDGLAAALAAGDATALARTDRAEADRVMCRSAAAWAVAGALVAGGLLAAASVGAGATHARVAEPRLLARESPYGVGYLVAVWA